LHIPHIANKRRPIGLISQALAPHTGAIVGVDISQGMVDRYNARVAEQGIPVSEMRAVVADLSGSPGELDDLRFDVAVVRFSSCPPL
jgi:ubiquinone/menaquinone biosynthesis C-methylase UbiE